MTTRVSLIADNAVTGAGISNTTIKADDIEDKTITINEIDFAKDLVVNGTIVMWDVGVPIPTGWQLCNGTNGTPDLRSIFPAENVTTSTIYLTEYQPVTITNTKTYTRINLNRYYNPNTFDHFCTTEIGNPAPLGYNLEGPLGTVFREQAPETYGGYDNEDNDFSQDNKPYSGILGYVYNSPAIDRLTILQLTNGKETMWTETSSGEYLSLFTAGYIETGQRFYLPTEDVTKTTTSTTINEIKVPTPVTIKTSAIYTNLSFIMKVS